MPSNSQHQLPLRQVPEEDPAVQLKELVLRQNLLQAPAVRPAQLPQNLPRRRLPDLFAHQQAEVPVRQNQLQETMLINSLPVQ